MSNKYGARRVDDDGYTFASTAEWRRYRELKLLQAAGEITDLQVHPPSYQLVVNGVKIGRYTADFRYIVAETGELVVEDVKGAASRDWPLRKKLMKACHGIDVQEVTA